MTAQLDIG